MMTNTSKLMLTMMPCLLAACAGNSVNGTVKGAGLTPAEAVFVTVGGMPGMGSNPMLVAFMSDQAGLCDKLKANQSFKGATAYQFMLHVLNTTGELAPLKLERYTITTTPATATGNVAQASFNKLDSTCASTVAGPVPATAGSIELTSFSVNMASGGASATGAASADFDLTFGTDRVTGSFSARYCEATLGTPTCP